MLVQWRVVVSWCSFPIEWRERMSEWNPLTICQHIFFRICQFQLTFTLARWTNQHRPDPRSSPISRSTSLSLSFSLPPVRALTRERGDAVQLTIIKRNMRMCIEISDYEATCSKIVARNMQRSDELTCDSSLAFCTQRSTIGWSWFNIWNYTYREWNEHTAHFTNEIPERKGNALVSEHGCCPDQTSVPSPLGVAQMWRSTVQSIEYSSNICLDLVRAQWESNDFFLRSIHHVAFDTCHRRIGIQMEMNIELSRRILMKNFVW